MKKTIHQPCINSKDHPALEVKQIRNFFFLATFAVSSLMILGFSVNVYAQFQDLSCPSCIQIPEDEIELYKSLFPLVTWTDDVLYDHDSTVILEGYLRPELMFNPITITVTNPIGNIVTIEQITPNSDGSFMVQFSTASNLWASDGEYIVKSQSGSERVFKNKIELTSLGVGQPSQCKLTEITVTADNGGQYCIPYAVTGETIGVDGSINTQTKTLTLDIRGKGIETITIELPRYLLDSKSNGQDSDFIILFNGQPTNFEEGDGTNEYRILTISYSPDRRGQIEIIGTSVVPEFGTVAVLILVMTIVTVIVLSKSSNLSYLKPKI